MGVLGREQPQLGQKEIYGDFFCGKKKKNEYYENTWPVFPYGETSSLYLDHLCASKLHWPLALHLGLK